MEKNDDIPKRREQRSGTKKQKRDLWTAKVFLITLAIATVLSFFSETVLMGVPLPVAILVLFTIIFIGIVFDMIGVSVQIQDDRAFSAMASKRMRGAKQAIRLIQNSTTIANICSDVVGDICGIISGAMGAAIALGLISGADDTSTLVINVSVSALIAAITVSGKSIGKKFADGHSLSVVFWVGRCFSLFARNKK